MTGPFDLLEDTVRERLAPERPAIPDAELAVLTDDHFAHLDWIYERKLDGQRVLALREDGRVRLRSRNDLALDDPLRLATHRNEHGPRFLEEACRHGWEGLIAKDATAPYHSGRSRDWLKSECVHQQELAIGGFTAPKGSRTRFGALLVGHHEDGHLRYAGKVGTGYDRATLDRLGDLLEARTRRTSPFDEPTRERPL